MFRFLFTTVFCAVINLSLGQNLVLNGDFESYSDCPSGPEQLDLVENWFDPTPNNGNESGSPDYFNSCSENWVVTVPETNWGYQEPHSGDGFVGILTYLEPDENFREYIETRISEPLIANNCYGLKFYISLGEACQYSGNDLQVFFSTDSVAGIENHLPLPFSPQIVFNDSIVHYPDWLELSAEYYAHGGEEYLVIGNFKDDTETTLVDQGPDEQQSIYVFIDDVSLIDLGCVTTAINEETVHKPLIHPNPFSNHLQFISHNDQKMLVQVYDSQGNLIYDTAISDHERIDTHLWKAGIYFYTAISEDETLFSGRIMK